MGQPSGTLPGKRHSWQHADCNSLNTRKGLWTLDDIPWDRFDRDKLDLELVAIVKAASLVEYNGYSYGLFLARVFHSDPLFRAHAARWGEDEVRHGRALGRWAAMADPEFDFAVAVNRFRDGYRVDFDRDTSRRGSHSAEMIARCVVEAGTSMYYSALCDAAEEPVLKDICRRIAADEIRHYKLFHRNLTRVLRRERIGFWRRLQIVLGRIAETADDELAYAYYAANEAASPYDRRRCGQDYQRRAYAICRLRHVTRATALIFKTVGLRPGGRLCRVAARLAWLLMRARAAWLRDFERDGQDCLRKSSPSRV